MIQRVQVICFTSYDSRCSYPLKLITNDYAKFSCMMEEIFQQDKDISEASRTFNFSIYIQFSVQLVSI